MAKKKPTENKKEELIKEILLKGSYISKEDLEKAEKGAEKIKSNLVDYLLGSGLLTKDLIGQAIAEYYGVTYADLNSNPPPKEQVLKIPKQIAFKYRIVPFKETEDKITITCDDPEREGLAEKMQHLSDETGKEILIAYSLPEDIDNVFIHYRKKLETRFSDILKTKEHVAPEILNEIFDDALIYKASDIHFEPQLKEVIVRFRIDGILHEAGRISKNYYDNVLNRIKVQSKLRTDDHFSAQDSSLRYLSKGKRVDMRISIVPTLNGEKIAIRLLTEYVQGFTLHDLGLSARDEKILEEAIKKPFGMILNTGPTGSGKSTTLYSLLRLLDRVSFNITTIEDPVEYRMEGINQIQVNKETDLSFAKGLRSIVRQDPDVILVGEVRDEETAEISVNAALTGHLLFSTFHANDAATAIPRLIDMGIEEFLLASTLEVIIAQRLVRKICEKCKKSYSLNQTQIKKLFKKAETYFKGKSVTLYTGKGCNACNETGYKGRTAIFELIEVNQKLKSLILTNPSSQQINDLARKEGSRTLFEDGIEKAKAGITSIEEVLRVAEPPEDK
jgi:type II secretory ATPase GspE/PulE/Tfp pilus assembly ATPase PilB-like protein